MQKIALLLTCAAWLAGTGAIGQTSAPARVYSISNCVNQFSAAGIESTKVGYQYWFADKNFVDGRTLKLSAVAPKAATHPPHVHPEDEFFFVLEGTAEFILEDSTRIAHPYASFYCPPGRLHGIRNVGESELKYLVVKKYPQVERK